MLAQHIPKQKDFLKNPTFSCLLKFLCAERIFSKLCIINDNYLNVGTVENLLSCKDLIKFKSCYDLEPNDQLIKFRENK